ncbi:MAG TPA: EamA family transporter [Terriglobales bacterium]
MTSKSLILISVVLSGLAQVSLKKGMNHVQQRNGSGVWSLIWAVLRERFVWLWGFSFIIATSLWLVGLQKVDLSYAYPLVSLGYVLVSVLAIKFFNEKIDSNRWTAILVICAGVMAIAGS